LDIGIWPLGFMKRLDFRLKLLVALSLAGVIAIAMVMAWWFWATSVRLQFGDPAQWPEHITEINNMAFRYPSAMEVIVPEDQLANPVSIVKKGERGESVLIQVGTWRPETPLKDLEDAAKRFEAVSQKSRKTLRVEPLIRDGRAGIVFVQDDRGGRRIWEMIFWDETEAREISLQLPGTASAVDRTLYERVFQDIFATLDFLTGSKEKSDGRPSEIPERWHKYESKEGGFAMWYPGEWVVASEFEEEGIRSVIFQPQTETENAVAFEQGSEVSFVVHAGPSNDPKTLNELDVNFASLFRNQALEGTLSEERFSFPDVGSGISLEATQKIGGKDVLSQLVLLVGAEGDENVRGRAYVFSAIFPRPQENTAAIEFARLMMKSFRLLEQ